MKYFTICSLTTGCLLAVSSLIAAERKPQVKSLRPGVRISLVAEHPDLSTPTGIDVDEQGRIWVVATHTHFRPDDYVGPEHDEILVFTDRNGDGSTVQRQVFYNATDATMDLELGRDGWVYLAERDRILRIKDTDGDGKADIEENIATLKTEANYPHNGLEGMAWHPDGDLVFALGENYAKPWTLKGTDGTSINGAGRGGIFRCTADGKKLKRIASGFWNPFGVCVRADGEIFAAENDPGERPPCRVLHIVEGGDYGYERSYGAEAHHPFVSWNGELRGTLPMIHPSGEAPCGLLPLGRGLLVPSWSDHRIDFFPLTQKGATYESKPITLVKGGRYFRPSCIAKDPGAQGQKRIWYLSDWVDGRYQTHGYGRLWKLEVDLQQAPWVGNLDLEPPTQKAQLSADLRSGKVKHNRKELLRFAQDEDPFLAQSALISLSREASIWTPEDVTGWSAADRVQAVLALKLANASPQKWIKLLLSDKSVDVQFETLRWISDARLKTFLPEVEQKLSQSDLDYRRFEAAIATWNTLKGKPEAGIRNPTLLLAKVKDANSAPRIRAYALRLLPTQPRSAPKEGVQPVHSFPKELTLELLQQLLELRDEVLSLEVVRTLAANSIMSQKLLVKIAADPKQSVSLRAEAIAGLASVAEQNSAFLLKLAGDKERIVREEALRSLRSVQHTSEDVLALKMLASQHPESADLFQAALAPKSLTTGRPALTDTQAWLQAIEAVKDPADLESGRRIFHHARLASCSHCHRHGGRGNVVGPDLSSLGNRKDRMWVLRSILEPSREMAPEYQPRTIILNDGRTFTGIRLRSYVKETIRDANGQNRTFDRNDIEMMVESPTSFMPSGLVHRLTDRELKDLIAYLESNSHRKE
ncbi:PVC-type heme-binding CxxCH protein [Gimesia aquarii]|uniref:Cytochrome c n=1 Tax=Gimesia aquarii TaxID=2527964 RepID=A0A517WZN4_9PLAN|nr:PVC-type heme-binding CxxCH protein [Gimesia aquarii]QDU10714.1 Cytochrome c [Gimesia aquarii]